VARQSIFLVLDLPGEHEMSRIAGLGKLAFGLATTMTLLPALALADDKPVELNFGIYTSEKPTEMINKFKPVTQAIEGEMGKALSKPVSVHFQVSARYQDGIKSLAEGKVDFSRLGPASFIETRNMNSSVEMLAVESSKGSTVDYGIICVKEDSPIQSVADLKGKSFAFGEENSTIGRYLSQSYLLKNGIKSTDLSKMSYLGRHDAVGAAVGSGLFDAGALKEGTFKKLVASGTKLREIARFPNASQVWVGRGDLAPEIKAALKSALLGLSDPVALKAIDSDKLLEGQDGDFDLVRQSMAENKEFFPAAQ
jgi:phosphonate transport system substrate-binding protein